MPGSIGDGAVLDSRKLARWMPLFRLTAVPSGCTSTSLVQVDGSAVRVHIDQLGRPVGVGSRRAGVKRDADRPSHLDIGGQTSMTRSVPLTRTARLLPRLAVNEVVIGVDAHKRSHTLVAVEALLR